MNKTPLSEVKSQFGSKDKLVDALVPILEKSAPQSGDEDKESLKRRLSAASNAKLLRLYRVATWAKEKGGRGKVTDTILDARKRSKDEGFRARLAKTPLAQLVSQAKQVERASGISRPLRKAKATTAPARKPTKAAKKAT